MQTTMARTWAMDALSSEYCAIGIHDRTRDSSSFSCVFLATDVSCVLTWALTIHLLQFDINLTGIVIAHFSSLNFLYWINGRVEICYRFGVFSLTLYVCSMMGICVGAESQSCLLHMEIENLNNFTGHSLLAMLLP
jgi:hypothetical protein